jgi:hypothetical protein
MESIEGNRYSSGSFHEGDIIRARSLNNLGISADFGHHIHSDSRVGMQGIFGTVDMSPLSSPQDTTVQDYPFKISVGFNNDGIEVAVRPGTVNNRIPKIAGVYMDAATPPKITIDQSGIWDILIKATKTVDSFFPDTIEVLAIKRDTYSDSNTVGYLVIGSLTLTGTAPELSITFSSQHIYASQILVRTKAGSAQAIWNWTSR